MDNIHVKALHLVREGRVEGLSDGETPSGEPFRLYRVAGDHAYYTVRWDTWGINCDCPARRRCSHQVAVRLFAESTEDIPTSVSIIDPRPVRGVDG